MKVKLLSKNPVLKSQDYEKPFKLIMDSRDVGTGAMLLQKNKNQKLVRWSLPLQEYNLEIQHIPWSEYMVADALSRYIR